MRVMLNTKELIATLNGENKKYIQDVEKQQEQYGNYDIFDTLVEDNRVEIQLGDYWIAFYFNDNGEIIDTLGTAQGSRYHEPLEKVAKELFETFNNL